MLPQRIVITVVDKWPHIELIIEGPKNIRTETSMYDIAVTQFEPLVKNAVMQIVQNIHQQRKERIQSHEFSS